MTGGDQAIAAIVAFAAENREFCRSSGGTAHEFAASIGDACSGRFHELKAGNAIPLGGQAVNLAHLGCGENFHGNSGLESEKKVKGDRFSKQQEPASESRRYNGGATKACLHLHHPAAADVDDLAGDVLRFF